jgi:hypothetical protein
MGYTDKSGRMTSSYSIQWWIWKWKKTFSHPLAKAVVKSFLLLTSCGV